jgi:hypothetical protein
MGLTHSASSTGKINSGLKHLVYFPLNLLFHPRVKMIWSMPYRFDPGFISIFIYPIAPFIPFISENVFGNKSSYSRNRLCIS